MQQQPAWGPSTAQPVQAQPAWGVPAGPAPTPVKKKRRWPWVVGGLVIVLVALAALGGGEDDEPTNVAADVPVADVPAEEGAPAEPADTETKAEPAPPKKEVGNSRTNPAPLATPVATGSGWTVTVNSFNPNANDVVAAANKYLDPPAEGHVFVIVNATAAYQADSDKPEDESRNGYDVTFKVLGADGNARDTESSSFLMDGSISWSDEVYSGGALTGDLLFQVPVGQVDSLVLVAEATMSWKDSKSFHALR